jgi:putative membrane protein insertion efficiency factor
MKRILIGSVSFYQKNISPRSLPRCKYYPTCSHYAIEVIEKHGAFKGFFLSIWRILRCNPFSRGVVDPVPDKIIKGKKER